MTKYIIKETTIYDSFENSRTFIANVNDSLIEAKRKVKQIINDYMNLKHRSTGIKYKTTGWFFYNPILIKDEKIGFNLGQIKYTFNKGTILFELFVKTEK